MIYIIDTNVLLDYPQVVEDKENTIIIPTGVLKELDGLKKHINPDIATHARRAAIYISKNMDTLRWYDCDKFDLSKIPVDDQLIKIGKDVDGIVITNDIYLKVRCIIQKVKTKGYSPKDDYTGVEYWYVDSIENEKDQEDLSKLLNDNILSLNEFYFELGMKPTDIGYEQGWDISKGMIEVSFSSIISEDDKPCIVMHFDNPPQYGFDRFM